MLQNEFKKKKKRFKPYCLAAAQLMPSLNKHKGKGGKMALLNTHFLFF